MGLEKETFFKSLYTAHVAIKYELKDEEISELIKKVIYIFILCSHILGLCSTSTYLSLPK